MTIYRVRDRGQPIGDALDAAAETGILVESGSHLSHALLPLSDDVIDFLLERNPALIEECREIGLRMEQGEYHTHEEARRLLTEGD
jgi:hypothetical protein